MLCQYTRLLRHPWDEVVNSHQRPDPHATTPAPWVCCAAGWSIAKQAAEVDDLKQQADLANERAAQASGAQQLRQVRRLVYGHVM